MKRLLKRIWDRLVMLAEIMAVVLLLAAPAMAEEPLQLARMNAAMLGSGGAACIASVPGSDNSEIGTLSVGGSAGNIAANRFYCSLYSADCSGTLGISYVYTSTAGTAIKVAVYSTTDTDHLTSPTNGSLLGASTEITSTSDDDAWYNANMSGGSVTKDSKYWVCLLTSEGVWSAFYGNGLSRHYVALPEGGYAEPPSSLPTSGWTAIANRNTSFFVGIQ